MLDRLEKQYPVDFEQALHMAMIENASNDKRKEEIRKLLGASWDIDSTTLFLKLNNTSAEVRLDATGSVVKALQEGKVCTEWLDILIYGFNLLKFYYRYAT